MKKQERTYSVNDYLKMPYTIALTPVEQGGWFATIQELVGCSSDGETMEEALASLKEGMRDWIESSLEDAGPLPLPFSMRKYKGTFLVRTTPVLHQQLVERAEEEGVSLNQFCELQLAESLGRRSHSADTHERSAEASTMRTSSETKTRLGKRTVLASGDEAIPLRHMLLLGRSAK